MQLHLNNKSFLILLSPFILGICLYILSDTILEIFSPMFTAKESQMTYDTQKKTLMYQHLTTNKETFSALIKKMNLRDGNVFWISQQLYHSQPIIEPTKSSEKLLNLPPLPPLLNFNKNSNENYTQQYHIQAILPDQKIAIINHKIYRLYQSIDGIKLLQVDTHKVYIDTPKGKQWVYLFH